MENNTENADSNGIETYESDGNTSFLRAARNGQLEKVLEYLKTNIDINTSNANGLNALHLASKDGHVEIVEELLKRGAIVDAATKKGNTALHIASLAGQEEVVKLLVQHGASVNVQSQNGFTPLYMAAQENHDNVVKFLLANGANQSLSTEDGFTPLAVAMQQGHDKVVTVLLENDTRGKVRLPALHIAAKKDDVRAAKLLLENDHNPDVTSKSGFTPLHIASHYGNQPIANLLVQKGADVNYSAKHNITPLHVAAKWGKSNMVSLLLEQGAHIEAKTRDGLTPLHCAARSGHEQVVDMLLEKGAPISSKTKNGLAPLHMAAQGDHVDAARILLYHRAPVDEVTVDYLTALHVAAHCGHVRVAKLLLDRQADANARALNGFTPLHIACKKNRIKVVELLLKHGACIGATTESGLTPLHVASFMGCMNIVIYLLQHDASPDIPTVRGETPLHLAARANQTDIIRILLRNGAQVDARAREQQTPLHVASRLGNVDIVMLLLQHGAKIDNTTKDMYTSLHIAAKEGQDEVAAVLIENGASLNSTTKKGFTPLHLAAKYGHLKVAKLLVQKEAPVDAQGKNGVTPLHVASHYDHQNVALLLLDKGASPHANAKNGHTPLHIAARKNQMDIANTLLEYGAKPDVESKAGFTPLHLSSQEGHVEISSLLLEHRATPDYQSKNGLTPMHLCAQENKVAVAELLHKNGAEIDTQTKGGYTPLHIASHYGQADMVKFLLSKGADVKATTSLGYTPLHQAAQQGHTNIVNILLENSAQPNSITNNGQTPLHIAQKLGYITVIDTLKEVTDSAQSPALSEEKYRVVAPELMHETFLSDSEEEGEDTLLGDQTYRYLTADEMKSLGDDSLPIDVTRDERVDSNRMVGSEDPNAYPPRHIEDAISPEHIHPNYVEYIKKATDNVDISRHPVHIGFLVSFLVDARGGAMRGCRHSGVRVIVPPRCAPSPTRITCRYVRPQRTPHPPPLMEGEALASRVLELGPVGAKFLGPVIIEVPHFAALRGKEREIVILRSDNGESWKEHTIEATEDVLNEVLRDSFDTEDLNQLEDNSSGRTTRIITQDFPQYFAVISRIRQEVHAIGPEGGMVSSTVVPQVQAVFPQGALTKKIKVGLQAQPIDPELTAKLLGHGVAVSPVVTVEPRRRKFHKAITLSMPAPRAHSQGMINQYSGSAPTLRLLCSITGGTSRAQWEDVTGSTPLTFVNDCVSFTTTVSARFWLMDCRNIGDATKMATELYREAIHVPFIAKFVVFAKRIDPLEARLRVFCMTDDKEDKTLEYQEQFTEIAKSRDVEVMEGKSQYVEFAGNLVPITKSGEQLQFSFRAFKENRLPFSVRVKDQHAEAVSRCLFMREPKVQKGEAPQQPICILNIVLPDDIVSETISLTDSDSIRKRYYANENFDYYRQDPRLADMSNLLGEDWVELANQLGLTSSEINVIKSEYPDSVAKQAQSMLRMWLSQSGNRVQTNTLENALRRIGRDDIANQCLNVDNRNQEILRIRTEEKEKHRLISDNKIEDVCRQERYTKEEKVIRRMPDNLDKYSAEEKTFEPSDEEEDFNKSVPERREQIVKRLSTERTIPASSQRVEIVQEISSIKRQSLVEDKIAEVQQKANIEPMKINTIKPVSKIIQEKMSLSETKETTHSEESTEKTQVDAQRSEKKDDTSINNLDNLEKPDRRDSVLLEEVTQLLEIKKPASKLIEHEDPNSPKFSKTPPPSPADFIIKEKQATTIQEWNATEDSEKITASQPVSVGENTSGKTTSTQYLIRLEEKLLDKTVDPPFVAYPKPKIYSFSSKSNENNAFPQFEPEIRKSNSFEQKETKTKKSKQTPLTGSNEETIIEKQDSETSKESLENLNKIEPQDVVSVVYNDFAIEKGIYYANKVPIQESPADNKEGMVGMHLASKDINTITNEFLHTEQRKYHDVESHKCVDTKHPSHTRQNRATNKDGNKISYEFQPEVKSETALISNGKREDNVNILQQTVDKAVVKIDERDQEKVSNEKTSYESKYDLQTTHISKISHDKDIGVKPEPVDTPDGYNRKQNNLEINSCPKKDTSEFLITEINNYHDVKFPHISYPTEEQRKVRRNESIAINKEFKNAQPVESEIPKNLVEKHYKAEMKNNEQIFEHNQGEQYKQIMKPDHRMVDIERKNLDGVGTKLRNKESQHITNDFLSIEVKNYQNGEYLGGKDQCQHKDSVSYTEIKPEQAGISQKHTSTMEHIKHDSSTESPKQNKKEKTGILKFLKDKLKPSEKSESSKNSTQELSEKDFSVISNESPEFLVTEKRKYEESRSEKVKGLTVSERPLGEPQDEQNIKSMNEVEDEDTILDSSTPTKKEKKPGVLKFLKIKLKKEVESEPEENVSQDEHAETNIQLKEKTSSFLSTEKKEYEDGLRQITKNRIDNEIESNIGETPIELSLNKSVKREIEPSIPKEYTTIEQIEKHETKTTHQKPTNEMIAADEPILRYTSVNSPELTEKEKILKSSVEGYFSVEKPHSELKKETASFLSAEKEKYEDNKYKHLENSSDYMSNCVIDMNISGSFPKPEETSTPEKRTVIQKSISETTYSKEETLSSTLSKSPEPLKEEKKSGVIFSLKKKFNSELIEDSETQDSSNKETYDLTHSELKNETVSFLSKEKEKYEDSQYKVPKNYKLELKIDEQVTKPSPLQKPKERKDEKAVPIEGTFLKQKKIAQQSEDRLSETRTEEPPLKKSSKPTKKEDKPGVLKYLKKKFKGKSSEEYESQENLNQDCDKILHSELKNGTASFLLKEKEKYEDSQNETPRNVTSFKSEIKIDLTEPPIKLPEEQVIEQVVKKCIVTEESQKSERKEDKPSVVKLLKKNIDQKLVAESDTARNLDGEYYGITHSELKHHTASFLLEENEKYEDSRKHVKKVLSDNNSEIKMDDGIPETPVNMPDVQEIEQAVVKKYTDSITKGVPETITGETSDVTNDKEHILDSTPRESPNSTKKGDKPGVLKFLKDKIRRKSLAEPDTEDTYGLPHSELKNGTASFLSGEKEKYEDSRYNKVPKATGDYESEINIVEVNTESIHKSERKENEPMKEYTGTNQPDVNLVVNKTKTSELTSTKEETQAHKAVESRKQTKKEGNSGVLKFLKKTFKSEPMTESDTQQSLPQETNEMPNSELKNKTASFLLEEKERYEDCVRIPKHLGVHLLETRIDEEMTKPCAIPKEQETEKSAMKEQTVLIPKQVPAKNSNQTSEMTSVEKKNVGHPGKESPKSTEKEEKPGVLQYLKKTFNRKSMAESDTEERLTQETYGVLQSEMKNETESFLVKEKEKYEDSQYKISKDLGVQGVETKIDEVKTELPSETPNRKEIERAKVKKYTTSKPNDEPEKYTSDVKSDRENILALTPTKSPKLSEKEDKPGVLKFLKKKFEKESKAECDTEKSLPQKPYEISHSEQKNVTASFLLEEKGRYEDSNKIRKDLGVHKIEAKIYERITEPSFEMPKEQEIVQDAVKEYTVSMPKQVPKNITDQTSEISTAQDHKVEHSERESPKATKKEEKPGVLQFLKKKFNRKSMAESDTEDSLTQECYGLAHSEMKNETHSFLLKEKEEYEDSQYKISKDLGVQKQETNIDAVTTETSTGKEAELVKVKEYTTSKPKGEPEKVADKTSNVTSERKQILDSNPTESPKLSKKEDKHGVLKFLKKKFKKEPMAESDTEESLTQECYGVPHSEMKNETHSFILKEKEKYEDSQYKISKYLGVQKEETNIDIVTTDTSTEKEAELVKVKEYTTSEPRGEPEKVAHETSNVSSERKQILDSTPKESPKLPKKEDKPGVLKFLKKKFKKESMGESDTEDSLTQECYGLAHSEMKNQTHSFLLKEKEKYEDSQNKISKDLGVQKEETNIDVVTTETSTEKEAELVKVKEYTTSKPKGEPEKVAHKTSNVVSERKQILDSNPKESPKLPKKEDKPGVLKFLKKKFKKESMGESDTDDSLTQECYEVPHSEMKNETHSFLLKEKEKYEDSKYKISKYLGVQKEETDVDIVTTETSIEKEAELVKVKEYTTSELKGEPEKVAHKTSNVTSERKQILDSNPKESPKLSKNEDKHISHSDQINVTTSFLLEEKEKYEDSDKIPKDLRVHNMETKIDEKITEPLSKVPAKQEIGQVAVTQCQIPKRVPAKTTDKRSEMSNASNPKVEDSEEESPTATRKEDKLGVFQYLKKQFNRKSTAESDTEENLPQETYGKPHPELKNKTESFLLKEKEKYEDSQYQTSKGLGVQKVETKIDVVTDTTKIPKETEAEQAKVKEYTTSKLKEESEKVTNKTNDVTSDRKHILDLTPKESPKLRKKEDKPGVLKFLKKKFKRESMEESDTEESLTQETFEISHSEQKNVTASFILEEKERYEDADGITKGLGVDDMETKHDENISKPALEMPKKQEIEQAAEKKHIVSTPTPVPEKITGQTTEITCAKKHNVGHSEKESPKATKKEEKPSVLQYLKRKFNRKSTPESDTEESMIQESFEITYLELKSETESFLVQEKEKYEDSQYQISKDLGAQKVETKIHEIKIEALTKMTKQKIIEQARVKEYTTSNQKEEPERVAETTSEREHMESPMLFKKVDKPGVLKLLEKRVEKEPMAELDTEESLPQKTHEISHSEQKNVTGSFLLEEKERYEDADKIPKVPSIHKMENKIDKQITEPSTKMPKNQEIEQAAAEKCTVSKPKQELEKISPQTNEMSSAKKPNVERSEEESPKATKKEEKQSVLQYLKKKFNRKSTSESDTEQSLTQETYGIPHPELKNETESFLLKEREKYEDSQYKIAKDLVTQRVETKIDEIVIQPSTKMPKEQEIEKAKVKKYMTSKQEEEPEAVAEKTSDVKSDEERQNLIPEKYELLRSELKNESASFLLREKDNYEDNRFDKVNEKLTPSLVNVSGDEESSHTESGIRDQEPISITRSFFEIEKIIDCETTKRENSSRVPDFSPENLGTQKVDKDILETKRQTYISTEAVKPKNQSEKVNGTEIGFTEIRSQPINGSQMVVGIGHPETTTEIISIPKKASSDKQNESENVGTHMKTNKKKGILGFLKKKSRDNDDDGSKSSDQKKSDKSASEERAQKTITSEQVIDEDTITKKDEKASDSSAKKKSKSLNKSPSEEETTESKKGILGFLFKKKKPKNKGDIPTGSYYKAEEFLKTLEDTRTFLDKETEMYDDVENSNELTKSMVPESYSKPLDEYLKNISQNTSNFIQYEIDNYYDNQIQEDSGGILDEYYVNIPEYTAFDFIKEEIETFEGTRIPNTSKVDSSIRIETEVETIDGDSPKEIITKKIIISEKLVEMKDLIKSDTSGEILKKLMEANEDLKAQLNMKGFVHSDTTKSENKTTHTEIPESEKNKSEILMMRKNNLGSEAPRILHETMKTEKPEEVQKNIENECVLNMRQFELAESNIIEDVSPLERAVGVLKTKKEEIVTDLDDTTSDELSSIDSHHGEDIRKVLRDKYQEYADEKMANIVKSVLKEEEEVKEKAQKSGGQQNWDSSDESSPSKKAIITKIIEKPNISGEVVQTPEDFVTDLKIQYSPYKKEPKEHSDDTLLETFHPTTSEERKPAKRKPIFRIESEEENLTTSNEEGVRIDANEELDNLLRELKLSSSPVEPLVIESSCKVIEPLKLSQSAEADIETIEKKLRDLGNALDTLEFNENELSQVREKKLRRVERKFERMASELNETATVSKQTVEITKPANNEQYQQLVSQLSQDEVMSFQGDYNNLWDEYTFSKSDEWDSKTPDSQADALELPQGEISQSSEPTEITISKGKQESTSETGDGSVRQQPTDQHQLSSEMKELLKEMEEASKK